MFRHLTTAFSLGAIILFAGGIAQAQFGGVSVQIGGNGYGNNYRNLGYGNPYYGNSYYGNYGSRNLNYSNYGYSNNGYFNNGYYNNGWNGGYINSVPNYYRAPIGAAPIRRLRRW